MSGSGGHHFPAGAKSEWAVPPSPHSLGEMPLGPPSAEQGGRAEARAGAASPWVSPSS